ncbi:MAG: class III signal peptide-containing protein [Candidatus Micrarchaeota archaeon]
MKAQAAIEYLLLVGTAVLFVTIVAYYAKTVFTKF